MQSGGARGRVTTRTGQSPLVGRLAWALYDWANNGYAAVVLTFVFAAYFTRRVAPDPGQGTALWGYAIGAAGLAVALTAPVLGAVADRAGPRKPWLAGFTAVCVVAVAAMWFVRPAPDWLVPALLLGGIAAYGSDGAAVFYNAMLGDLVPRDRVGRWSGWAWALGYAGGLICLVLVLYGFVRGGGWLGLPTTDGANVRAAFLFVAAWYAVFALPLFLWTPDRPARTRGVRGSVRQGLAQLRQTVVEARRHRAVGLFLLARLFYVDALATVFALGGAYAADVYSMDESGVLRFGIPLNVTAGLGAVGFSWVTDRIGDRATLTVVLVCLAASSAALLISRGALAFWVIAAVFGLFVGPVQSASRSYLSRLSPDELRTQFFGLYAFSGKATAFAGPLLAAAIMQWSGSRRLGMAVIVVFFTIGLVLLRLVPVDRSGARSER